MYYEQFCLFLDQFFLLHFVCDESVSVVPAKVVLCGEGEQCQVKEGKEVHDGIVLAVGTPIFKINFRSYHSFL